MASFGKPGKQKSLKVLLPAQPQLPAALDDWLSPWQQSLSQELELEQKHISKADLASRIRIEFDTCRVGDVQLTGAKLLKLKISDSVLVHIEAAGLLAPDAAWLRVLVANSRFTGADSGKAQFEDCTFDAIKFDEAAFRFATFQRVWFKDCILTNADFTGAKFTNVVFSGCTLEGAIFDQARCVSVDFRGEKLGFIKGLNGLKGAMISSEQLIELAPLMALELGLHVEDDT